MSTRAIREALESFREKAQGNEPAMWESAVRELEAIEKAARVLAAEGVDDAVYNVRDRAAADASFSGNTWEHPRVLAYGEAAQLFVNIARESLK